MRDSAPIEGKGNLWKKYNNNSLYYYILFYIFYFVYIICFIYLYNTYVMFYVINK